MKVKLTCPVCNTAFERFPSQMARRNYCSNQCRVSEQSPPMKLVCPVCDKDFERDPHHVGDKNYCSKSCFYEGRKRDHHITLNCDTCDDVFDRRAAEVSPTNNFCCKACQHAYGKKPIVYCDDGETALVPVLDQENMIVAYATIDVADAEWADRYRWHLYDGYAKRVEKIDGKPRVFSMHRELLGLFTNDDLEGDHWDRNRLNNRRRNLRAIPSLGRPNNQNTSSQKGSTSKYRGVSWSTKPGKWHAQVRIGTKCHHLGFFDDELQAARVAQEFRQKMMPYSTD